MLSADRGNEKANATAAERRRRRRTSSCCLQCSLQGAVALRGIWEFLVLGLPQMSFSCTRGGWG